MLAGSLSQEDEDAVLAELEAITQVGPIRSLICVFESDDPKQHSTPQSLPDLVSSLISALLDSLRETSSFLRSPQTSCQKSRRPTSGNEVCSVTSFLFVLHSPLILDTKQPLCAVLVLFQLHDMLYHSECCH